MKALFLKIFQNEKLLTLRPFTDKQISVGSGEGLNLKLEGASPWHCLIEEKEGRCKVSDLGSEFGTFLNGKKIEREASVQSGDFISFQDYHIQVFFNSPPDKDEVPVFPTLQKGKGSSDSESEKKDEMPSSDSESEKKDEMPSLKAESFKKQKGVWSTFAPPSKIKNLDEYLEPSIGNLIEVVVAWKERILSVSHFSQSGNIYVGNSSNCSITLPSFSGIKKYKLLKIHGGARVFLKSGFTGALIQGKNKSTREVKELSGEQNLVLKPYEMFRINFSESVCIYVRIIDKPKTPVVTDLFKFRGSELAVLFFSFLLTMGIVFYSALYAPLFLLDDVKLREDKIRIAKVSFEKTPLLTADYKLSDKMQVAKKIGIKKKKPKLIKRTQKKKTLKPKKTVTAKPRRSRVRSKVVGVKKKRVKLKSGSARPGGSLKTGKRGSSPKTVAPDPTKVGLLGVLGGGGNLKKLDKGSSGTSGGGILGLAKDATGFAGTQESYSGEGIGTKTKDVASGGRGSSLVGISGIKTKNRGKDLLKGKDRGGGLGTRGFVNIEVGAEDIEVEGEIDRAAILRVIRKNRARFDSCYQASLQQNTSLQGQLKMRWKILSNGRGNDAGVVDDGVGSSQLSGCMSGVLESLRFPAPPSGQIPRISFKFIFSI